MDTSPFSRLSAEIRNEIYRHALSKTSPMSISCPRRQFTQMRSDQRTPFLPGLLTCCRQIRQEGLQLFYALNSFEFKCNTWRGPRCAVESDLDLHWVHSWLDVVGPRNRKVLTSVNINLGRYVGDVGSGTEDPSLTLQEVVRQARLVAPDIALMACRIPAEALSISSTWMIHQHQPHTRPMQKTALVEAKGLRIFRSSAPGLRIVLPYVASGQNALFNSTISDLTSACLVGTGRAMLILFVRAVWLHLRHVLQRKLQVSDHDVLAGDQSLESLFAAMDGLGAKRAMAILPDEFRGYPLSVAVYEEAIDHADDYDGWIEQAFTS